MTQNQPKKEKCLRCDGEGHYFAGTLVGFVSCESCSPSYEDKALEVPDWEKEAILCWGDVIIPEMQTRIISDGDLGKALYYFLQCNKIPPETFVALIFQIRNQTLEEAAEAVEHQLGTVDYSILIRGLKK